MDKHNHKGGLIPPKKEYIGKRVFSYPKYFGAPIVVSVPDFQIGSPRVKNQGGDGTCTVFAATSVSEDQEGVELEPAYQWLKTAQLGGVYPQGAAPGDVCKSLTKFGSLSVAASPLHLPEAGASVVQIKQNWDKIDNLDSVAFMYRKRSYFELEGLGDRFDSIRQILWANKLGGVTAFVGLYWQPEWTYAQGGICAFFGNDRSLPHAIKIFGQKTINGVVYLMVQNSWGKEVGDQGIF